MDVAAELPFVGLSGAPQSIAGHVITVQIMSCKAATVSTY